MSWPRKYNAVLSLTAIITACQACSYMSQGSGIPLYMPEILIIRADSRPEDPAVKTYGEVLDAVTLNWRTASADRINELTSSGRHLVLIIPMGAARSLTQQQVRKVLNLVGNGAVVVSEGITPLSSAFGFRPGKRIPVSRLQELAYPDIEISWEKKEQVTGIQAPDGATVMNHEPDTGTPIVCLLSSGRGHCLLLAAELSPPQGKSYARFPYFLRELQSAGVAFPFRSERLSALCDYAYHLRDNPDRMASMWRNYGIEALHISAWSFYDGDEDAESFLKNLIDACHRSGILVYAWLELPHVSEEFWLKHPEWREKTATGRDAHVDWREAMNLLDPQCFQAVAAGLERLIRRFDGMG